VENTHAGDGPLSLLYSTGTLPEADFDVT